jgi:hypothetical protein
MVDGLNQFGAFMPRVNEVVREAKLGKEHIDTQNRLLDGLKALLNEHNIAYHQV